MKILHVNAFDFGGGAARAAMRLHEGLRRYGVDSHFVTVKPTSGHDTVFTPLGKRQIAIALAKRHAAAKVVSMQKAPTNGVIHSLALFSSGLGRWIETSDFSIVNLHWICAEALSIREIAQIRKPIVWTMHDMWPFMGAEHYDDLDHPGRWKTTYTAENRPPNYKGLDIDYYIWTRKAKLWAGKEFQLVSPSNWLADCARGSALMCSQPCEVIHNPIDMDAFGPVDKSEARRILGLPLDKKLILFGAMDATSDQRKGYDLLVAALYHLERDFDVGKDTEIVVFGGRKTGKIPNIGLKSHFLGVFQDDLSLRVVYSAADVFVAPSRQDNLPNTVVEAGACGLQTAAFDIGGMSDILVEDESGTLARPFDVKALAGGIHRLLTCPIERRTVRAATQARFSLEATIPAYVTLYHNLLKRS